MFIDSGSTYFITSQVVWRGRYASDFFLLCLRSTLVRVPPPFLVESCQEIQRFFLSHLLLPFHRSQKTPYLMSLFVAGRKAVCAVAQIIGRGFSAGEGKLRLTPGRRARRDASFLSAPRLKKLADPLHFQEREHPSCRIHRAAGGPETPSPSLLLLLCSPLIFNIQG